MPSLGSVGKLTCEKASSSTITCLLLPGSSNVLVVFVEVAIANCDGTCTTVLLLLMANIPPVDWENNEIDRPSGYYRVFVSIDHGFFK